MKSAKVKSILQQNESLLNNAVTVLLLVQYLAAQAYMLSLILVAHVCLSLPLARQRHNQSAINDCYHLATASDPHCG